MALLAASLKHIRLDITVSANHLPSPRTYQLGIKTTLQGYNPFLKLGKRFVLSNLFIAKMLIIFVHPQTC